MLHASHGFTLVELLVSIGIMATLATMGFAAIGNFTEKKKLKLDSMNLASEISNVRLMAYSGKKTENIVPPGGYGFLIKSAEPTKYYIYADKNGNSKFDPSDVILETKMLSANIKFSNTSDGLDVCFRLQPAGGACFFGADCGSNLDKFLTIQGEKTKQTTTLALGLQNGLVSIDSSSCPAPYMVLTEDKRCVWSCSLGTTPSFSSTECVCKPGLVVTGYDQFGRRICQ
jgi:prepilin-type N-terminal cleavage/methylation domain-containing protein